MTQNEKYYECVKRMYYISNGNLNNLVYNKPNFVFILTFIFGLDLLNKNILC